MAITLVQAALGTAPSGAAITVAFTSPVTAGNFILAIFWGVDPSTYPIWFPIVATDSLGNAYIHDGSNFDAGDANFDFVARAVTGGRFFGPPFRFPSAPGPVFLALF